MTVPVLLLRRARAQVGTLLTLLVLVASVATILGAGVGYTRAAGVVTVRGTIDEAAPTAAGVQVRTRLAEAGAPQDSAVRAVLADRLGDVDLDVTRTLRTEVATAELTGTDDGAAPADPDREPPQVRVVLGELPADTDDIIVTGDLPGPGEVLVPGQSTEAAGLAPGSELTLRGATLTVSGTWQAVDPEARTWFADPMVAAGADGTTYGPLLATTATIEDVDPAPFVLWTVYPETSRLTVAHLPGLAHGLAGLDHALDTDTIAVRGLTVEGSLAQTVAELQLATSTAAAVGLVPVALLAIISVVALVQVVRLLGQTRAREIEILVARGAHPRQVTLWSAAELAVVAVVAAGAGTAVALAVIGRLDGGGAQRTVILAVGTVVALVATLGGSLVAGLQARAITRRLRADRSGRLQGAATFGTIVLAAAAAVLSAWQLLRHGTPLISAEDGSTQADALAVVSLGAVLGTLAVLALALLGPLTRLVAAARARSRGLGGVLAARQVSRRVRVYAVPLVLIVLAAASTTVAASFAGATVTQREQVAALAAGADVRVTVPTGATSRLARPQSVTAHPYTELPGVAGAGTVLRSSATIGSLPVTLTALNTREVQEIVRAPQEIGLPAAAAELAGPSAPGVLVPAGTDTLELTVRAQVATTAPALAEVAEALAADREHYLAAGRPEDDVEELLAEEAARRQGGTGPLRTTLWVLDPDGAPSMLTAPELTAHPQDPGAAQVGPEPTEHILTIPLPDDGEHQVVAIDLDLVRPELATDLSYEVLSLAADGTDLPLGEDPWAPVAQLPAVELEPAGTIGTTGTLYYDWQLPNPAVHLRLVPERPPDQVPVAISEHLATVAALDVGDRATVHVQGASLEAVVSDVVLAVPGGLEEDAALLDLGVLSRYLLGVQDSVLLPGELWLTLDDPLTGDLDATREVAAAAREIAGPRAVVDLAGDDLTDSAASVRETFWIAAAGATVLALTGVAAVTLALARERRSEVMVLRALGLPPGAQARSRSAELLGVGLLGMVLGALAGWAGAALLVPTLARAAATQATALPLGTRLEPAPALVLLGVLVVGLGAVATAVAARVRRQALDAEYREEVR